jgi:NAD(P)-dependent dehydrogenase (short-subunit alcohol dehydrogenase family)
MGFGAESTTDEVVSGIRLDGKHVLVTGSTGGLGIETARSLASIGASVTISGRNPEKIAAALATLREQVPDATFDSLEVDLASLASIADATKTFVGRGQPIDLLINNAGVMMCPEGQTADGFETQFGTNHLGHFAWTAQLMPAMANSARVVTLSSGRICAARSTMRTSTGSRVTTIPTSPMPNPRPRISGSRQSSSGATATDSYRFRSIRA